MCEALEVRLGLSSIASVKESLVPLPIRLELFPFSLTLTLSSFCQSPHASVGDVDPQLSLFQSPEYLQQFCGFVLNRPGSPQGFQEAAAYVEDIGDPLRTDFMFCENNGSPQGMKMGLLGKKVRRTQKGRMFVRENGTMIRAGGVHLQGGNKATWPLHVPPRVHATTLRKIPLVNFPSLGPAFNKAALTLSLKAAARLRRVLTKH